MDLQRDGCFWKARSASVDKVIAFSLRLSSVLKLDDSLQI